MTYQTDEARLCLPDTPMRDMSINILKFPELGTTLVISRGELEAEDLESSFDRQLKKLEQQVKEMRFQHRGKVTAGPDGEIDALEVRNQFVRGPERIFQYQLACVIPDTRTMLALSYVKSEPLGDAEAAHWQAIKASLTFPSSLSQ